MIDVALSLRAFNNCHAELVSASHETLKRVQGDKKDGITKRSHLSRLAKIRQRVKILEEAKPCLSMNTSASSVKGSLN